MLDPYYLQVSLSQLFTYDKQNSLTDVHPPVTLVRKSWLMHVRTKWWDIFLPFYSLPHPLFYLKSKARARARE